MSTTQELPPTELQGYTLLDRLGAGGYGEVWRAQAPGGLAKAVKFVFGRQDEQRATAELKALERIKEVRHPFLLSLERIEIADGRLVVVTELADSSLRDRFQACLDEGLPGIPRPELIGYLRDTADALDFLSNQHGLQHLDIKPENLLLLAGHVKVADFGLVKSVSNQAESLVGGMTPTYAAPEVFQGQPSTHSDQYSLAVLYQELLTGVLPFPGSNAAELTLQHLNEEPNLDTLSGHDRYVLCRALAKDPDHRFDCCADLVRALADGDASDSSSSAPVQVAWAPAGDAATPQQSTDVFEEDAGWSDPQAPILIDLPPSPISGVRHAETPTGGDFQPSPAVFIGVGGAGARVLRALRRRFSRRFDGDGFQPSLPMLLLDTDTQALAAATRSDRGDGLLRSETVALPLRRAQDYREKSPQLLRWIGRRWLYNIPRSLQTECIRPLGRLALVDHARQAYQRLRRTITESLAPESLDETRERTGLDLRADGVRIYLCGSISGGAGSGMSFDVAYAVRSILQRLGVSESQLIGVMLHSTSRTQRRDELARVNAYSWLAEWRHFENPEVAYPGDESCGLPAQEAGVSPFDATYLVDAGSRIDTVTLDEAAQSVADFLYADAVTAAQPVLDACRAAPTSNGPRPALRTFSIKGRESASAETRQAAAAHALDQVLTGWSGDAPEPVVSRSVNTTNPIVRGAAQLVGRLKLDAAGLASLSRSLLEAHLGDTAQALDAEPWAPAVQAPDGGVSRVLEPVERLFTQPSADAQPGRIPGAPTEMLRQRIETLVTPLAQKLRTDVGRWIVSRIDTPGERVAGARRAAAWFRDHLAAVQRDLNRLASTASEQSLAWSEQLSAVDWATAQPEQVASVRRQRLRQLVDLGAIEAAAGMAARLQTAVAEAEQETAQVNKLVKGFRSRIDGGVSNDAIDASLQEQISTTRSELDRRAEEELLAPAGGLRQLAHQQNAAAELQATLQRLAEQVVNQALDGVGPTGADDPEAGFDCPLPPLAECGAVVRKLAVLPAEGSNPGDGAYATVVDGRGEAFWIVEADGLSAPHVAAEFVDRRRDYATLGQRVHTRKDVAWSDLLAETPEAETNNAETNDAETNDAETANSEIADSDITDSETTDTARDSEPTGVVATMPVAGPLASPAHANLDS